LTSFQAPKRTNKRTGSAIQIGIVVTMIHRCSSPPIEFKNVRKLVRDRFLSAITRFYG
jgi:hypothetical protein